jgi:FlaA1/EpsC-like NDP-sugar epimerase
VHRISRDQLTDEPEDQTMRKAQHLDHFMNAAPRGTIWALQIGVFALSAIGAFLLRFDFRVPSSYLPQLFLAVPVWLVVKTLVFRIAKLDRGMWRYVSAADLVRVAYGNVAASLVAGGLIIFIAKSRFPRSIFVLDLLICFVATGGLQLLARAIVEARLSSRNGAVAAKITLIYGAGDAGVTLLKEIRNNPKLCYRVSGFVDDQPSREGLRIDGVPVLGGGDKLKDLVAEHQVELILIAIPSAGSGQMTRILELCYGAGVEFKTVPGLGDLIEGNGIANQVREVAVEDLLGRTPIRLEESRIRGSIENKMVLVTGAAGSIGSELCRQIARFNPAGIVGFDIAESPLFEIDREMRESWPQVPFYPEIGSIQNRPRLDDVLGQYRPSVVYHAAAYKHVPLMEEHVFEAVENNVFGTYNVADAAAENGVEDFVMISSDKAVRPTNVMGATKRIAELLLLGMQNGRTRYVAVRFGNVLGSNGSVIPIFKKQIASGGPVTVTHPEMRRFFMTIPEACQLVLQASTIGEGGQICILEMGEPVKIVDLARNLILLSGLKPDDDIQIQFIGIRPGEKLYEELNTQLEDTVPTGHEKIRVFIGNGMPPGDVQSWLRSLREICEARDAGSLVVALKEIVLDYNPSSKLLKRVIEHQDLHATLTAVN